MKTKANVNALLRRWSRYRNLALDHCAKRNFGEISMEDWTETYSRYKTFCQCINELVATLAAPAQKKAKPAAKRKARSHK